MKSSLKKVSSAVTVAFIAFPTQLWAHGSEDAHQKEVLWMNILLYGILLLFLLSLFAFLFARKKVTSLANAKSDQDRNRRVQLSKAVKGLKWASIIAFAAVIISGFTVLSNKQATLSAEPTLLDEVTIPHGHGMAYSPDGAKLFFAVHDGLRVYQNGQWILPPGEKHDYMGFSMVDDGFYSSGHPAKGSNKKNPFGIVKSKDEGKTLDMLTLYGEVDFHGMSVGYNSHAIYVFNPAPNAVMSEPGVYYSTDDAQTWTKSALNGLEGQPSTVSVHPTDEEILAVGTEQGIFISRDHGQRFEKVGPALPTSSLFFNATGELYAAGLNPQPALIRLDIDTKESKELNLPSLSEEYIAFIGQSPVNEQDLAFMTSTNNVYLSSDGGSNWTQIVKDSKGTSQVN